MKITEQHFNDWFEFNDDKDAYMLTLFKDGKYHIWKNGLIIKELKTKSIAIKTAQELYNKIMNYEC